MPAKATEVSASPSTATLNRQLIPVAAVAVHICIGSVSMPGARAKASLGPVESRIHIYDTPPQVPAGRRR